MAGMSFTHVEDWDVRYEEKAWDECHRITVNIIPGTNAMMCEESHIDPSVNSR